MNPLQMAMMQLLRSGYGPQLDLLSKTMANNIQPPELDLFGKAIGNQMMAPLPELQQWGQTPPQDFAPTELQTLERQMPRDFAPIGISDIEQQQMLGDMRPIIPQEYNITEPPREPIGPTITTSETLAGEGEVLSIGDKVSYTNDLGKTRRLTIIDKDKTSYKLSSKQGATKEDLGIWVSKNKLSTPTEGKVLTNQDLANSGVTDKNFQQYLNPAKATEAQYVAAKQIQYYNEKGGILPIEQAQGFYRSSKLSTPIGE